MKESLGDRIFTYTILIFLVIISLICLFPFINVLAMSFSSNGAIMSGKVSLWPVEFTTGMFKLVLTNQSTLTSIKFTVILTVLFTVCALIATILLAYPMSRKFKGKKQVMIFIVFTMYFSGGMIPSFLVVKSLGLLDSIWSLILPGLISTYYFIIMRTFFNNIPESLIESANLDGANELQILIRIVLPISLPVIASITLFYAVGRWNNFSDAVYYISTPSKFPLQLKLREVIMNNQVGDDVAQSKTVYAIEGIKAATIMVATIPILIVYPFLQKYFVSGMTLGSVKG